MKRIHIVDGQQVIRELIGATLRVGAYQILQAENGEEAIEVAGREKTGSDHHGGDDARKDRRD